MVSSGAANGTNVDGSEGSYFSWQLASQDVAGNFSRINWQVGWRFSTTSCRGLRKGSAKVNGSTVYNDQDAGDGVHGYVSGHDHQPKLQTASGVINIAHLSNGTKTFVATFGMTGWDGGPNLLSNGTGSWALPTIPRLSSPPGLPIITDIQSTSVFVTFTDGTGGAAIDSRRIGYGTSPTAVITEIASDGSTLITGLTPGTTYYFWAATHNVAGWTGWSPRATAVTTRTPDAPSAPVIYGLTQTSVTASFVPNFDGGSPITGYQIGYDTASVTPSTIVAATSPKTITGLDPGIKYYFWVRAQNSVGWGPWSSVTGATTIAGARVKVGGVWKTAIPYVRVGGVWKLAQPWVRVVGVWKETT